MKVGSLGKIIFQVSEETIQTLRSAKWTKSADYSTHKRHGGTTLNEFICSGADGFSFALRLSAFLGVDVGDQMDLIHKYIANGIELRLIIGKKSYGRYKWVITKVSVTMEYYDKRGNLTQADLQITLSEYLKK